MYLENEVALSQGHSCCNNFTQSKLLGKMMKVMARPTLDALILQGTNQVVLVKKVNNYVGTSLK